MKKTGGFTIVEYLAVIVILTALLSIITVKTIDYRKIGRDKERMSDLSKIATALEAYKSDHGYYPIISWWDRNIDNNNKNWRTFNCLPGTNSPQIKCDKISDGNGGNPNYGKNPTFTNNNAFHSSIWTLCLGGFDGHNKCNDARKDDDKDAKAYVIPNDPAVNIFYKYHDFYPGVTIMPNNLDELSQKLLGTWDSGDGSPDLDSATGGTQKAYLNKTVPFDKITDSNLAAANEFKYWYNSYFVSPEKGINQPGQAYYLYAQLESDHSGGVKSNKDGKYYYEVGPINYQRLSSTESECPSVFTHQFPGPGRSLISFPAEPFDPDPAKVFEGYNINNNLYRYVPGSGYVAYKLAGEQIIDFKSGANVWYYIGFPSDHNIDADQIKFRDKSNGEVINFATAISSGWIQNFVYGIEMGVGAFSVSIPGMGAQKTFFEPWYGYQIYVMKNNIEMIVP
jgi:type II secretory pathway pseudopilin PulG